MQHRNNFDALRLLAALLVMVSHAFALTGRAQPQGLPGTTLGTTAVYVFFAISGFLVTQSWKLDPNPLRFAAKRFLRIVPGYVAVLAIIPLALWMTGRSTFAGNPIATINGSLWTIPFEIQCYVVFLILAATTRFAPACIAIVAIAMGDDAPFARFASYYAAGALIAEYPQLQKKRWIVVFVSTGALLAAFRPGLYSDILILAPLCIAFGSAAWPGVRSAGRFGDFSYGTYLYAFPVQQSIIMAMGPSTPVPILLGLAVAATLPIAAASWFGIERPALALKKYLEPKKPYPSSVIGEGSAA
jgi:peptidoglycan/LPS O-acetylase OafA/YrhL